MLSLDDREQFATSVIEEVRRWPGVELRPHASSTTPGEADGIEFRLFGRQIGHVHGDCSVHLALTKALKARVVDEHLAQPVDFAPTSGWATFTPTTATPLAASSSPVLREHEAALGDVSPAAMKLVQRTQARSKPRPFPTPDA